MIDRLYKTIRLDYSDIDFDDSELAKAKEMKPVKTEWYLPLDYVLTFGAFKYGKKTTEVWLSNTDAIVIEMAPDEFKRLLDDFIIEQAELQEELDRREREERDRQEEEEEEEEIEEPPTRPQRFWDWVKGIFSKEKKI